MKTTPIYLKSVKLSNIKTFGENVELDLENTDGKLPNWTLILGNNGIGKSTLLQCIAWMKPNPPDPDSPGEELSKNDIEPTINNEENETLLELVRRKGSRKAVLESIFVASRMLNSKEDSDMESNCVTKMLIRLNKENKLEEVVPNFDTLDEQFFLNQEIVIYAYSASRSLGKLNLDNPELEDTIPDFIKERTELYDADVLTARLHEMLSAHGIRFDPDDCESKRYS